LNRVLRETFRQAKQTAPRPVHNNREAEVERLTSVGATRYPWRYNPGSDFVVLQDPGGNLFCVVEKADG
jgi:hypothetical protein